MGTDLTAIGSFSALSTAQLTTGYSLAGLFIVVGLGLYFASFGRQVYLAGYRQALRQLQIVFSRKKRRS